MDDLHDNFHLRVFSLDLGHWMPRFRHVLDLARIGLVFRNCDLVVRGGYSP